MLIVLSIRIWVFVGFYRTGCVCSFSRKWCYNNWNSEWYGVKCFDIRDVTKCWEIESDYNMNCIRKTRKLSKKIIYLFFSSDGQVDYVEFITEFLSSRLWGRILRQFSACRLWCTLCTKIFIYNLFFTRVVKYLQFHWIATVLYLI